ncbi:MAG: hypothetical protein ACT4QC_06875 [Planctomycetaceae bacterium]
MKSREKLLAISLLGILAVWQGKNLLDVLFLGRLNDRIAERDRLETDVRRKSTDKLRLLNDTKKLKAWSDRSLPRDPIIAATEYDKWLIDQASRAKLSDVRVTTNKSSPRIEHETYYRITARIDAQGTLERLCDFLHAFQQTGFLHRVTNVKLESQNRFGDNPTLNATIDVQALALRDQANHRTTLVADGGELPPPHKSAKDRAQYATITAKNVFAKGYNGPPKPPAPPRRPEANPADSIDAAEHVVLTKVGKTTTPAGVGTDAWLYDRLNNRRTDLTPGEKFSVAGLEGVTLTIDVEKRCVIFEINGDHWKLGLGENLRQMKKVPPTETARN